MVPGNKRPGDGVPSPRRRFREDAMTTAKGSSLTVHAAAMLGQVAAAPPTSEEVTEELKKKYLEYFGIYLKCSNYVIASFNYPVNARVHVNFN